MEFERDMELKTSLFFPPTNRGKPARSFQREAQPFFGPTLTNAASEFKSRLILPYEDLEAATHDVEAALNHASWCSAGTASECCSPSSCNCSDADSNDSGTLESWPSWSEHSADLLEGGWLCSSSSEPAEAIQRLDASQPQGAAGEPWTALKPPTGLLERRGGSALQEQQQQQLGGMWVRHACHTADADDLVVPCWLAAEVDRLVANVVLGALWADDEEDLY
ncbi:hypothetical protein TSOC_010076 [Tetrabaena socialis]|uniref:Uncharacterized protein n=1 Tax=Tetrabaena socialis TaxID=47790 RepID=A0A2J7ZU82_9CHLO|nr:hypothetical protein TSOC_010076 [Tetrabaena socialis]|eukprot:PNH03835.1 hypothetical protein TSOC_010076 [Tetrabaena socialis]